jgi:hypothetical protein
MFLCSGGRDAHRQANGSSERMTGNLSEVMQMLQTAAFATYALGRDSPSNQSLATPSRYDLSAPPPASQVLATGVVSARQTVL